LYAYDPPIIILGGSLTKAYAFFETTMKKELETFYYPEIVKKVKIVPGTIDNIAILGAAALMTDWVIERDARETQADESGRSQQANKITIWWIC